MRIRPSIYLAGRVTRDDWRSVVVPGLSRRVMQWEDSLEPWAIMERSIEGFADYSGPFPMNLGIDPNHGWTTGEPTRLSHGFKTAGTCSGCHASTCYCDDPYPGLRDHVARECLRRLALATHVFAFLNRSDSTGSIAEIGYAKALGLPIEVFFSTRKLANNMWFLGEMAARVGIDDKPESAWLRSWTRDRIIRAKAEAVLTDAAESPIEAKLAAALAQKTFSSSLRAQHVIGPYRADLALLDHRIVIECDGHNYHSSKEQRGHDAKRDRFLTAQGWRVVRCTGTEIHADVSKVVADIEAVVNSGASE